MADVLVELVKNATFSLDKNIRDDATTRIKEFLKSEGSLLALSTLIESQQLDLSVRQAVAIAFKNHVKQHWANSDSNDVTISRTDKDAIKKGIVNLLLGVPLAIQSQLMETLAFIGELEFPTDWPTLLPELIEKIKSNDFNIVNPVLMTANALFKKYRHQTKTNQVILQLQYILSLFPTTYLQLFGRIGQQIKESANNPVQLKILFTSMLSLLEIFLSLSSIDLPEFFEDNLAAFTIEFQFLLTYNTTIPELIESKNGTEPSLLSQIHTVICEILNLYTQLYDDEFSNYLQPFVGSVWNLLSNLSKPTKDNEDTMTNDRFINASLKFLSTVSMSIQYKLFEGEETLKQICSCVVTPNIQLKEADIELFEDNPTEYMRRDIEGSDADTRRRAAIELVKGLRNLVPVVDFFREEIAPELQKPDNRPILVADCLKFISIFRNQLPVEYYPSLLTLVISCLANPDYIVHTYASTCIDYLLQVKDKGVPRISADYLQSNLPGILLPLVKVLEFPCSRQNERTMRPIARIVLQMISRIDKMTSIQLLEIFTKIAITDADNPSNHAFDHYCFEVIGSILKSIATVPESFKIVMPLVQYVLQKDVQEFAPYTFQLLAILVENASIESFAPYREIFPPLYHPNLWKRNANVPALIFSVILARISSHKTDKIVRCFIVFLGVFIYKIGVARAITICNTVKPGLWELIIEKLWIVTCDKVSGAIEKKIISIGMTLMLCSPDMFTSMKQSWISIATRQYQLLTNQQPAAAAATTSNEEEQANYIDTEQPDGYVPTFTQLQFTKKQDTDPIPQVEDPIIYFKENFTPIYQAHRVVIDQLYPNLGQLL
ncbi:hypothetical protein PPL_12570 [Heterostelium album PN500]|uniref:Importin N-terminal domain-containing protein n=1 Tax=Heterostelium pallidum (strain ATCC 26659 / Pp 5 / PN500) TaxID=670386 RepID=D3BMZ6_HETP5|nr:hypothetical protein PPL_12570 [Heterostelium album PN500]EFA77358.1 hypothetical protein PPL_12570 [Heterostelium album PN500]|eukprot:XP_020429487.1 hypothetical protein PPL_12570 [Heterostelium album PN500]